ASPVPRQSAGDASGVSLGRFFRDNRRFTLFLLGSVLVFYAFSTVASFFLNVVENAGGTTATMGWLSAYMAGLEIPVMMCFFWFRRRWSPTALLRFSFVMFVGKAVLLALAKSVSFLYVAYLLQPLSYGIYNPAVVLYVEQVIPFRDSAKGQSLAFSTTTVGGVLANLIAGVLYDRLTVAATLWIAAAVCAVGAAVCIRSVQKTPVCPL
ncbi:MAG: MFS transporter, partial [Oscillospiraceae bacterium]|nr:MFS transporter [Oscillospiraceae bacterium]